MTVSLIPCIPVFQCPSPQEVVEEHLAIKHKWLFHWYPISLYSSVRPPKKSWKNISNLSGGEKTLSSLALVFALHHYKPTPLYVMDEIDAALDFKNVSIVANYIKVKAELDFVYKIEAAIRFLMPFLALTTSR